MSGGDIYSTMAALAQRLAKLLAPARIIRKTGGGFDPVSSMVIGAETQSIDCRAVAKNITIRNENGASINAVQVIANAELRNGDIVEIGALAFPISEVEIIAPDGAAIMWKALI